METGPAHVNGRLAAGFAGSEERANPSQTQAWLTEEGYGPFWLPLGLIPALDGALFGRKPMGLAPAQAVALSSPPVGFLQRPHTVRSPTERFWSWATLPHEPSTKQSWGDFSVKGSGTQPNLSASLLATLQPPSCFLAVLSASVSPQLLLFQIIFFFPFFSPKYGETLFTTEFNPTRTITCLIANSYLLAKSKGTKILQYHFWKRRGGLEIIAMTGLTFFPCHFSAQSKGFPAANISPASLLSTILNSTDTAQILQYWEGRRKVIYFKANLSGF